MPTTTARPVEHTRELVPFTGSQPFTKPVLVRASRVARSTGAHVAAFDTLKGGAGTEHGDRWELRCLTHDASTRTADRYMALRLVSHPENFCAACAEVADPVEIVMPAFIADRKAPPAPTFTVKLPPRFYDDHVARDLPGGVEVRRNSKGVVVELTPADIAELRGDAHHYVASADHLGPECRGLVASARATLRALDPVDAS